MKKALVIDDSTVTRLMIRKIISESGGEWDIHEADTADKALPMLLTIPHIDLITVDQNMPGTLSGLDFIEKARIQVPNLKIVLITANIQAQIKNRAIENEVPLIEKPITVEKLKPFLN